MRFAVISDVHGNLLALRRVIDHMKDRSVDGIINLGDCVTAPLWPQETFDLLEDFGASTVRGNHDGRFGDPERIASSPITIFCRDRLSSSAREALVALPASLVVAGEALAVHGTPASDTQYLLEDAVDERLCLATAPVVNGRLDGVTQPLVLCGHSHQQNVARAGGRLIVNPGSVGCPRYAGNARPGLNEAGSPHARYAVVTRRDGEWSAELFVLAYDFRLVVERARDMGFADWGESFMKES